MGQALLLRSSYSAITQNCSDPEVPGWPNICQNKPLMFSKTSLSDMSYQRNGLRGHKVERQGRLDEKFGLQERCVLTTGLLSRAFEAIAYNMASYRQPTRTTTIIRGLDKCTTAYKSAVRRNKHSAASRHNVMSW